MMKRTTSLSLLLLSAYLNLAAAVDIDIRPEFDAYLNDPLGFRQQEGSPDYRLLNPNPNNPLFYVFEDRSMRIANGVVIELEPDVGIAVYGQIVNNPSDGNSFTATDYLLRCYYYGNLDFSELRYFLGQLANDAANEAPYLYWVARKYCCRSYVMDWDLAQAIDEYRNILAFAPTEVESLQVELDIQMLQEDVDGAESDSYSNNRVQIAALEERLFQALASESSVNATVPQTTLLISAYPNPFNGAVSIGYNLPATMPVELGIYDLSGRLVSQLLNSGLSEGDHRAVWKVQGIPNGTYFCRLTTPNGNAQKQLLLIG